MDIANNMLAIMIIASQLHWGLTLHVSESLEAVCRVPKRRVDGGWRDRYSGAAMGPM
jgi:hypothetical protein